MFDFTPGLILSKKMGVLWTEDIKITEYPRKWVFSWILVWFYPAGGDLSSAHTAHAAHHVAHVGSHDCLHHLAGAFELLEELVYILE